MKDTTLLLTGYLVVDRKTLATLSETNHGKTNPRAWSYVQVFPSAKEARAWRRTNAPGARSLVLGVVIVAPVARSRRLK